MKQAWRFALGLAVVLVVLVVWRVWALLHNPAGSTDLRVTISKETTYITEPLREDGYVNYVAALNERGQTGVTPENNAAVSVLRAMWPAEIPPKYQGEYCRMLGIEPLPEKGDYFVTIAQYAQGLKDADKPADETGKSWLDILDGQRDQTQTRPWSPKEFPEFAGWLAANEKPLALILQASQRPRRYDPLLSTDGSVMMILLPTVNLYREAGRALRARAMLRLGEGKVDEAWEDLLACHRLARLAAQGPMSIELLVGVTVDAIACAGDQALLQHVPLTAAQAARMYEDLAGLPQMPCAGDKIDLGERFMCLDGVRTVIRDGINALDGPSKPKGQFDSFLESRIRAATDWDQVLRLSNAWFDRMTDACRKPTRAERQRALHEIDSDLAKMLATVRDRGSLPWLVIGGRREALSERIGSMFLSLFLPATATVSNTGDSAAMRFELTKLAFALAAYRADHGSYPAKLADLSPKYVAEVPQDLFTTAKLRYKPDGEGYLLYSVGPNGKDDRGRGVSDAIEGEDYDDISVRIPAGQAQ